MYSPVQQAVFPDTTPQRKLSPNLWDKVKYAVHYRKLKLYLQLGLVVTKVHGVLTFKQSPWLKIYIDFNTRQRSLAGNSFLKDFFKLMNNNVYGKTQENLRTRVHVELMLVFYANGLPYRISAIQCTVATLTLNRPIYVGFSVLELSKLHMYDFHYNISFTHFCPGTMTTHAESINSDLQRGLDKRLQHTQH